ncbi:hypothetical protein PAN31117_03310 [Pandoraea anapnoica]|uniref:Uncharacterized protein n=1 Tax=Pandoraea anapnoica TaxID=2508301 RepID=A0A5E5A992_9BURK|nr:hypothetical protein PAN31117_03310 [Pandoraea anapnoica]
MVGVHKALNKRFFLRRECVLSNALNEATYVEGVLQA